MVQRTKRGWSEADSAQFIATVTAARNSVFQLLARAPIGSPEYRALSAYVDAIHQAAIFLGRDWTAPQASRVQSATEDGV